MKVDILLDRAGVVKINVKELLTKRLQEKYKKNYKTSLLTWKSWAQWIVDQKHQNPNVLVENSLPNILKDAF